MRLDLWVPTEPVPSGAWMSTILRVTNVGEVPVWVYGYPDNLPCQGAVPAPSRRLLLPVRPREGGASGRPAKKIAATRRPSGTTDRIRCCWVMIR